MKSQKETRFKARVEVYGTLSVRAKDRQKAFAKLHTTDADALFATMTIDDIRFRVRQEKKP